MVDVSVLCRNDLIYSLYGEENISDRSYDVCLDSRKYRKGELFFGLVGDRFDGFDFAESVLQEGCRVLVFEVNEKNNNMVGKLQAKFPKSAFIGVENSLEYLQKIGHYHILEWKKKRPENRVIGITGSNGKTTQKDMLAFLLGEVMPKKVLATEKNFNNLIGVPLTLLQVSEQHQFAIIEMGSNHPGEIAQLCRIASPDQGIITSIGAAHLEFFDDENGVFLEKKSLFDFVSANHKDEKFFVVNRDDPFLERLSDVSGAINFGREDFSRDKLGITNKNITGEHNLLNLISCFLMASNLLPDKKTELLEAANSFVPMNLRSTWIIQGDKKLFSDAYNANPSSVRASVYSFVERCNEEGVARDECLFVVGDMNELGKHTERFHQEIGNYIKDLGVQNIVFVGKFRDFYSKGYQKKCRLFADVESFAQEWKILRDRYKYFFLKGSNSVKLESLLEIY